MLMIGFFSTLIIWIVSLVVTFADTQAQRLVQEVNEWLALVDREEYGASWDEASPLFQTGVTRDAWVAQIERVRKPLGKPVTRELRYSRITGGKLRVVYHSNFERVHRLTETITFQESAPGRWKVIGYLIKPGKQRWFGIRPWLWPIPFLLEALYLSLQPAPVASLPAVPPPPPARLFAQGAPFVATLPNGTMELLAVRPFPDDDTGWSPDGAPTDVPYRLESSFKNYPQYFPALANNLRRYEFVLQWDVPIGASILVDGQYFSTTPSAKASSKEGRWQSTSVVCKVAQRDAEEWGLTVYVADGEWQTIARQKTGFLGRFGSTAGRDNWSWSEQPDGAVVLHLDRVSKPSEDLERRFVAVDKSGKEHQSWTSKTETRSDETFSVFEATFGGSSASMEAEQNLRLTDITEFRMQVRRGKPVRFENISLRPGHKTTVTVRDYLSPSAASASRNNNSPATPIHDREFKTLSPRFFLSLTTGRTSRLPRNVEASDDIPESAAVRKWVLDEQLEVGVPVNTTTPGFVKLAAFATKIVPLRREDWTLSNDVIIDEIGAATGFSTNSNDCVVFGSYNLPATFGFHTQRGAVGLMEISGFMRSPPEVHIAIKSLSSNARKTRSP
jgi:hypothetical protein